MLLQIKMKFSKSRLNKQKINWKNLEILKKKLQKIKFKLIFKKKKTKNISKILIIYKKN